MAWHAASWSARNPKRQVVKHYVINGDTFVVPLKRAAIETANLRQGVVVGGRRDVYVDTKSGYPVAFRGGYSGEYEPINFEGDFSVDLALTGVNTNPAVDLPSACNKPISQ